MNDAAGDGNTDRFSGFADLYDANRPSPPRALGPLLASYANVPASSGGRSRQRHRIVVALGGELGGFGDRHRAERRHAIDRRVPSHTGVTYVRGVSHRTGLGDRVADVVLAVQAMHWMEPEPTLAEVARILRPGGVFAIADADWPPVVGRRREQSRRGRRCTAGSACSRRGAARGETGDELRRPIADDDPALARRGPS